MSAAQIKKQLIAEKAADKPNRNHSEQIKMAALGGETSQRKNGFAFEKSADENRHVTVLLQQ